MTTNEKIKEILKSVPLNLVIQLKIGENEYACKQMKKTMEEIKLHNAYADGYGKGYKEAMQKVKEWRNNEILKIEGLI